MRSLSTPHAPAAIGPYSQATVAGGFLFTAGQIALDLGTGQLIEGDVTVQAERVLRQLEAILKEGGCGWGDVVKTTIYLQDLADFPRVNEVYARVLSDSRPARSTVQVSALPRGALIEIDAIAKLP